ncbi:class I adenylate-forming enzyme family protein [Nocardioides sp.]|uniref:class I adenylate-forming enzyme family protein n=1 Tax=Nocardioides sp. TaxID=35761 RepID=UPI0027326B22|nr:class I adenylate-forming enzyme family protein [Nocardioides sp.]MDP3890001.1 class I adenylate-forming enzyme family protein [Nocardioides sp.]
MSDNPNPNPNLGRLLEVRAAASGDQVALYAEDERSWTFAEADRLAGGIAVALRGAGVSPGDRVATYVRNGPELALLLFGVWKLGAIPVTISSLYNAFELAESLTKTTPVLLVVDDAKPDVVAQAVSDTGVPARALAGGLEIAAPLDWIAGADVPCAEVDGDDEACIVFTGGTSGRPKAVSVTHAGIRGSLERLAKVSTGRAEGHSADAGGSAPNLIALPLFHSGGQHSLLFAFHVGRSCVVWERFGVDRLRVLMERFRFDNFFFLPTMLFDIVHAEEDLPFEGVKSVLVAGQALSWTVRKAFEERYRVPILMNYGSTESGHIAGWTGRDMKAGMWKPGSAGRVYPGVELEIRDDDGTALPQGESGEIVVRSEMTRGYVDDAAASLELVRDGWVHTGDMGYVDQDGVLFLVGRKRDMIKCGGFQVWPEEIEDELRAHPLVHDVRVVGAPDDRLGEIPTALVVRAADDTVSDAALAEQIVALARERLAHFKAPRRVEFVPELARSETGKIKRDGAPVLQDTSAGGTP